MSFFQFLTFFFFLICQQYTLPICAISDLTIVGFVDPNDGLGKVPINIIETLDGKISTNFIFSNNVRSIKNDLPASVNNVIQNPDSLPGKVALFTDILWDCQRSPYKYVPKECIVKLAYSMLETTQIPKTWVNILNEEFDAVVVPDTYLVDVYEKSGVKIPIFVLPIPMNLKPYYARPLHSKIPSTPFVFGDASANKNPGVLIEAFSKAFGNNPEIHLVLRAGSLFNEARETIYRLIEQFGLTNVIVEEGHISLDQYIDRLVSFDCYVNLSRGEGFSFIPREALALGIPVIVTNNTASKTICDSGLVRDVPCEKMGPCNSVYQILFKEDCGDQFDCDIDEVASALRDVYEHYGDYVKKAHMGRIWVDKYYSKNKELQDQYRSLIKPKGIIMGEKNLLRKGVIMTNSINLYQKYKQVLRDK